MPNVFSSFAISELTDKQKSMISAVPIKAIQDYFTKPNGADPDAALWGVVEDNDASVITVNSVAGNQGYLKILSGTAAGDDARVHTSTLDKWKLWKTNYKTIYMKSEFRVVDLTGEWALGFAWTGTADGVDAGNVYAACLHGDNDGVDAVTDDGSVVETTDISSYVSADNTWYTVEIRITTTDVKFFIDNTVRATHTTRVPGGILSLLNMMTKNTNSITTELDLAYIEVWLE